MQGPQEPPDPDGRPLLAEASLGELLEWMASRKPGPAAGSAAAIAAAMAAALIGKAAMLAERHLDDASSVARRAEVLRRRALDLAEQDTEAVMTTDWTASDVAAGVLTVPHEVGRVAEEVAGLANRLVEQGNPRLRADAVAAQRLADSAAGAVAAIRDYNEQRSD